MKNEHGQTLLEILTAIGVMVVLLTSITVAVLSSLNNATFSKNQNLATQYAQEGMEAIRNMRNTDYATFNSLTGSYCFAKGCTAVDTTQANPACSRKNSGNSCTGNIDNFFTREIHVPPAPNDCGNGATTEVISLVMWSDGHCAAGVQCRQVQVTSCFSNTTTVPAP